MDRESHDCDALMPNAWLTLPVAFLVVCGLVQAIALPVNCDAAWYLYMAGRILDGAKPYEDVVDTNPPLVVVLNMGIVGLARLMRLSPVFVFPSVLFGLIGVSLSLGWRLSSGLPLALRQVSHLAWSYVLLVYSGAMFGQREHIMLILILPYTYSAIGEARGARTSLGWAVLSGFMAGVGFALKPFFMIPAVAIELYLASRRGVRVWLRPQAWAMAAIFLIYGALLVLWAPNYFEVARRFAPLYPYHNPLGLVLWSSSWRLVWVCGAIAFAWVIARRRCPEWLWVLSLLIVGLTVAVYLTGKGWRYHWYPVIGFALALVGGSGAILALRWPISWRRARAVSWIAVLLPVLSAITINQWLSQRWRDDAAIGVIRANAKEGDAILILSCWVNQSFPLVNELHATWGMRHPMLWPIAAFYSDGTWAKGQYHRLEEMSGPERRFVGEIAEDMARYQPVVLLVDSDPPTPALKGFDYLDYLVREPRIARLLTEYEPVTRTARFRIYRRRCLNRDRERASLATAIEQARPRAGIVSDAARIREEPTSGAVDRFNEY
jgi:hypothetical protein